MSIPEDWLLCPADPGEAEARIAARGAPDVWLAEWRRLVVGLGPDDELWEYSAIEMSDPTATDWHYCDAREGYAVVRRGTVVDAISTWIIG